MAQRKPGSGVEGKAPVIKTERFIKSKRKLLSHAPTHQSLSFWSVVLPIKKLSYETLGQIKN